MYVQFVCARARVLEVWVGACVRAKFEFFIKLKSNFKIVPVKKKILVGTLKEDFSFANRRSSLQIVLKAVVI